MAYEVSYRVTEFFLDRANVQDAIGKARARALARQGAFVRRRWKSNVLRRRKRVSSPGSPPSIHSRDQVATLKNILFYYDASTRTVVVGPVKLNQRNLTPSGSISVPALLEFGGTARIQEERYRGSQRWFRRDGRRRIDARKQYRTRTAIYAARPSGSVALNAEIAAGTIAESWAAQVRGN